MLLLRTHARDARHTVLLGLTTAFNAGLVNVCSVMAFFAFSSNVTGHVAIFAEEIAKGHWYQVSVVVAWMLAFLTGAFFSTFIATSRSLKRERAGQAIAHLLQMGLLGAVAYYGQHHYRETLYESEILVFVLLLTMGLQNGSVANATGGVVKTTHLTGLFTDLGMEIARLTRKRHRRDRDLIFKFVLHCAILAGYIIGGLVGGVFYLRSGFPTLYIGCVLLGLILAHDLLAWWRRARASEAVTQGAGPFQGLMELSEREAGSSVKPQ